MSGAQLTVIITVATAAAAALIGAIRFGRLLGTITSAIDYIKGVLLEMAKINADQEGRLREVEREVWSGRQPRRDARERRHGSGSG